MNLPKAGQAHQAADERNSVSRSAKCCSVNPISIDRAS
jgi:hypothetical protein